MWLEEYKLISSDFDLFEKHHWNAGFMKSVKLDMEPLLPKDDDASEVRVDVQVVAKNAKFEEQWQHMIENLWGKDLDNGLTRSFRHDT